MTNTSFPEDEHGTDTNAGPPFQSQALLNAIKEYENNKWKTIGQKVGKPAKVSNVPWT
jgi:hypothetical protein